MSKNYEILPGTPYSQYALPLDYPPSRAYAPRWGVTKPPIPQLYNWFAAHEAEYRQMILAMRSSALAMRDVPLEFDPALLPQPAWSGVPYAPIDAVALYTMIRLGKPRRFVEIGSGISTCFAYKAIKDNNLPTKITSIDPSPRAQIDSICDEVIREGLEVCDVDFFSELEPGDILFFDGSHRSFMNSDVTVFMIDVLPRLRPGVVVHIHDINIPYDYPEMFKNWYWNEQYMLAVYLMGNMRRINPLLPTSFVCRDPRFTDDIAEPFIDLGAINDGWHGGGAMWFTHTA